MRFAAAHAARSLGWAMIDLLLAWHLHAVVGFSGVAVSVMLTIFLSTGALANLGVGYWLTARGATAPVYVRLQLIGAIATAILLAGQFLVRDPVAVTVIAMAFRIAFAIQDVPQSALGSLLPTGETDARRYAQLRVMLSGATRMIAITIHLLLLRADSCLADGIAFTIVGGLIVASAFGLRRLRFPARPDASSIATAPTRWPDDLPRLLFAFAAAAALLPMLNKLLIFMTAPGPRGAELGSWMLAAFCCGSVVGPLVQRHLARIAGDRDALLVGILVAVTSAAVVTFADAVTMRVAATGVHGAALSMIGVHLWANAARIAMRDAETGFRRDGLVVGAITLTTHLAMALGSLLLGPLIETYEAGDPGAALAALLIVTCGAVAILAIMVRRRTMPAAA